MPTIEYPSLADQVEVPVQGAGRDRKLQHFIDFHAAAQAAAALKSAIARASGKADVVATVLAATEPVLAARTDRTPAAVDDAAFDRLRNAVVSPGFLSSLPDWIRELRQVANSQPDGGACTVATALKLWLITAKQFFRVADGSADGPASHALDELVEALCPLVAARCLALDLAGSTTATVEAELRRDLSHVYAAHASAVAGTTCAELVFGYRRHLVWDAEGCASCWASDELDDLEALMPGIAGGARTDIDIIESDGSHPAKRGPCANFNGLDTFMRFRNRLDACLTGARLARERVAGALSLSMGTLTEGRA